MLKNPSPPSAAGFVRPPVLKLRRATTRAPHGGEGGALCAPDEVGTLNVEVVANPHLSLTLSSPQGMRGEFFYLSDERRSLRIEEAARPGSATRRRRAGSFACTAVPA